MEDVRDGAKGLQGSKSLSELPQNVQDAYRGYDGVGWQGIIGGKAQVQEQVVNLIIAKTIYPTMIALVIKLSIRNLM